MDVQYDPVDDEEEFGLGHRDPSIMAAGSIPE